MKHSTPTNSSSSESMTSVPRIQFAVLGIKEKFRGEKLIASIAKHGFSVETFWGRTKLNPSERMNLSARSFYYGRDLVPGESLCADGHRSIIRKGFEKSCDWLVVLEEDAIVEDVLKLVEVLLSVNVSSPTLLSFYFHKQDCLLGKRIKGIKVDIRPCYSIPTSTVCYALNAKALVKLNRGKMVKDERWVGFQADFPPGFGDHLRFFVVIENLIQHSETAGQIGKRGEVREKSFRSKINEIVRRFLIAVGLHFVFRGRHYSGLTGYLKFFHARALARFLYKNYS